MGLLYDLSQTRDESKRQDLRRQIQRMRRSQEHVDLPADGAGLLQVPLVPIVFEVMGLPAFDGHADWLYERLAALATPAQIDAALQRLQERELVERSGERWRRLRSASTVRRPATRSYAPTTPIPRAWPRRRLSRRHRRPVAVPR